ncbi:MAG TPA: hypothetical protein ENJ68_01945 [Devosia sp.]|nr:hypothetical protein [Devosia sp.]
MPRYSEERKAAVLKKLLPPHNRSVSQVAREEGISEPTLYNWRKQAKEGGIAVPGNGKQTEGWSAEAKFAAVVETASLSELELSEYCRRKELYPQQIKRWREACVQGTESLDEQQKQRQQDARADKKRIKRLERELRRKEKVLAEAAALLVLRKNCMPSGGKSRTNDLVPRAAKTRWMDQ